MHALRWRRSVLWGVGGKRVERAYRHSESGDDMANRADTVYLDSAIRASLPHAPIAAATGQDRWPVLRHFRDAG